jgi:hypothetical protein
MMKERSEERRGGETKRKETKEKRIRGRKTTISKVHRHTFSIFKGKTSGRMRGQTDALACVYANVTCFKRVFQNFMGGRPTEVHLFNDVYSAAETM